MIVQGPKSRPIPVYSGGECPGSVMVTDHVYEPPRTLLCCCYPGMAIRLRHARPADPAVHPLRLADPGPAALAHRALVVPRRSREGAGGDGGEAPICRAQKFYLAVGGKVSKRRSQSQRAQRKRHQVSNPLKFYLFSRKSASLSCLSSQDRLCIAKTSVIRHDQIPHGLPLKLAVCTRRRACTSTGWGFCSTLGGV